MAALAEAVCIAAGSDVGDAEAGDTGGGEQFEVVDGYVEVAAARCRSMRSQARS
jgi:hypothetical protein